MELFSFFYILHFTFYISIQAFYVSNHACTGSTQQKQCSCDVLASDGFCDLNDSRTVCGECLEPDALPALPPPRTEIPVNPVQTSPSVSISPSLNPSPQTPSLNSNLPSKEEAAVYKVVQGTIPAEAVKPEPEKTIVDQLLSFFQPIVSLFASPTSLRRETLPRFNAQSDTISQSSVPIEVRPKESEDVVSKLKGWLGGESGVYGKTLPPIEGVEDDISSYEELYQQASFPEGIYPIVDPTPTPLPI